MFEKIWLAIGAGILILPVFVSLSQDRSASLAVTHQECQIYQALYATSEYRETFYFVPETRSFDLLDRFGEEIEAPSSFVRDTGEYEEIELWDDGTAFERPVTERIEVDTSNYFNPVRNMDKYSIIDCFDTLEMPPRFFSGHFLELLDTEGDPIGDGMVTNITLASVSRVGFSDDQKFALIYTEHYCGGLCGAGAFVLFEWIDETWEIAGSSMRWIS